jgi:ArsR family transcriptional regulator
MEMVLAFKALSESARLRILFILAEGSFNVGELTELLGLSQPTVSHHLKLLDRAQLIDSQKEGTWVYYRLAEGMRENEVFGPLLFSQRIRQQDPSLIDTLQRDQKGIHRILDKRRDRSLDFFESTAGEWENLLQDFPSFEDSLQRLTQLIPQTADVLELGCGSGTLLTRILPRSGKTIGVDHSQAMLREAQNNLGNKLNSETELRLGRLEHLPVGDETVELAVSHMVFHHLPDPRLVLKDISRALKEDGELLICDLVKHDREIMREKYADLWLGFEVEEFQNWLLEAGFCDVTIEFIGAEQESFLLHGRKAHINEERQ